MLVYLLYSIFDKTVSLDYNGAKFWSVSGRLKGEFLFSFSDGSGTSTAPLFVFRREQTRLKLDKILFIGYETARKQHRYIVSRYAYFDAWCYTSL